jgi:hypothetical protein
MSTEESERILHHTNLSHIHRAHFEKHRKLLVASAGSVFVSVFAVALLYGVTSASTPRLFAVVEPEGGTRTGNASVVDDTVAAGKKYVRFMAAGATVPTTPTTASKIRRFPGDPNPKVYSKAYWGASIGGNADPSKHETPTGASLSVRRTFWQWADADGGTNDPMFVSVRGDLAKNRLPFISVKSPGWKDVADGKYDAILDTMLKQLDSYGKPIWIAFHHEPEGGGGSNAPDDPGGAPEWRRMQTKIRARMTALGTKNIAFMAVMMSYTWNNASGRTPNDWWVPGIWDVYCVDHYRDNISGDMFTANWPAFVTWIEAKGLPYCLGEWGNRGTDATAASEMQAFWDWNFTNKKDVVAYSYFDSALNSASGSWELTASPLTKFQSILKTDAKVQRINDL